MAESEQKPHNLLTKLGQVLEMALNATGERMIIEEYSSSIEDYVIYLMHVASYRWVANFIHGKRVLDFGCGSGYGAAEMAEHAAFVDGVDVSEEAVAHASAAFTKPNLRYSSFDADNLLPFDDGSFDVVTSFQVIEHVENFDLYVAEARRVLVPGGLFIVITPDRVYRLFPWQKPWNRWHIDEFTSRGLKTLLNRHFDDVDMMSMSGDAALCKPELDRCRKLKWSTSPFTLPIYPRRLRVGLLNLLHGLNGRNSNKRPKKDFPVDERQVKIGHDLQPSLNLVAVAHK